MPHLTIREIKVKSYFRAEFGLDGKYIEKREQIGNSAPPLLLCRRLLARSIGRPREGEAEALRKR
jgi:hypothetical protein